MIASCCITISNAEPSTVGKNKERVIISRFDVGCHGVLEALFHPSPWKRFIAGEEVRKFVPCLSPTDASN